MRTMMLRHINVTADRARGKTRCLEGEQRALGAAAEDPVLHLLLARIKPLAQQACLQVFKLQNQILARDVEQQSGLPKQPAIKSDGPSCGRFIDRRLMLWPAQLRTCSWLTQKMSSAPSARTGGGPADVRVVSAENTAGVERSVAAVHPVLQ